jgi:putative Mg2+ transporter-C (MgtC) family protein
MQIIANINLESLLDTSISLTAAFILGGLIGLERQYRHVPPACAPMLVAWARRSSSTWPTAWAAMKGGACGGYVVSGVGFLARARSCAKKATCAASIPPPPCGARPQWEQRRGRT